MKPGYNQCAASDWSKPSLPLCHGQRERQGWELSLHLHCLLALCLSNTEKLWPRPFLFGSAIHVPESVPFRPLSLVLLSATPRGHLLLPGTSSSCALGLEPPAISPGTPHCFCSHSPVPSRMLLPACLTTVSPRCGHLLLGGFPFFIRFDNAFFRD